MNQRIHLSTVSPFCSPIIYSYIILFYLLTRIALCSVNPKFQACEPKTCGGTNDQNISFPFYIKEKQQPFCGNPNFGLTCAENGFPIVNMSNNLYMIHKIFYNNQSLRVSIPEFSEPSNSGCIAPVNNFSHFSRRFKIASNQKEVMLFYGCDLPSLPEEMEENRIGCSAENRTRSVMAFYGDDPNSKLLTRNCTGQVVSTTVEDEKGGVEEGLRRGFVLNWMAKNCSECSSSGGRCGFDQEADAFRCYCRDRVDYSENKCDPRPEDASHKSVVVAVTVSAALGVVVIILIIYCLRRRLWSLILIGLCQDKSKAHQAFEAFLKNHGPLAVRRYSYLEIKTMTNSFIEKLGKGGYGDVFKGKIQDECLVAVKVLNKSKSNGEEFINEIASISRTSHINIVTLLGFCFEGSKRALVYEFMSNGSLEKFIYGNETNPRIVGNKLHCETLYQIAIGVARGLEYLHRGCNTQIFHFDIKPHNILLDENFCPKISDFGLAKICPRNDDIVSMLAARGTPGFIAPEVFSRSFGVVSHKSDVYSFGMMVLEMVGGRKNINVEVDHTSEIYFPYWIYRRLELNEDFALTNITNESDKDTMRKMVIVGLWCIQTNPSDRPTMHTVVDMLEGNVETLQIPPKPVFFSPSRSTRQSSAN